MRFAQNYYAWGLVAAIALLLFFILAQKEKRRIIDSFVDSGLLSYLAAMVNNKRSILKNSLLVAVVLLSVFSLMRPQWGFKWQEVKRKGLDILVALDTSKSMLAADVKPNRLKRSKLAIKDLVKKLSGDRIGLIAFSGTAYLQCPLTVDYEGFMLALENVDIDTISRGGTSISSAIEETLKVFENGDKKYKVLIIITDGEDHDGDIAALTKKANKLGIKIFTVGIGTKEGELIQVNGSFLKDKQGNVIKTRLNEKVLREIALATAGMYVHSTTAEFGLETIYKERLSKMEKQDIKTQMKKHYHERFQIFTAIALILLILEPFISDKKKIL